MRVAIVDRRVLVSLHGFPVFAFEFQILVNDTAIPERKPYGRYMGQRGLFLFRFIAVD